MDINRLNYETFFIDYLDGKLNIDQINELLSFLEQNADLKVELENFQKITLEPDTVFYESKEKLKRTLIAQLPVGESNFDAFCVAFVEKDLSDSEENALKDYVLGHPWKNKDFELYKKTLLTADKTIVYPFKEQRIKHIRILRLKTLYPYIAVAATLFIAIILIYRPSVQKATIGNSGKMAQTHVVTVKKQNLTTTKSNKTTKVFVASSIVSPKTTPAVTSSATSAKQKLHKTENIEKQVTEAPENVINTQEGISDLAYLENINVSKLPDQKYDHELKINNSQTIIAAGDFSKTIQNLPSHELALANSSKEEENETEQNGLLKFAKNSISRLYSLLGNPIKIERKTDSNGNTLAFGITAGSFQLYSTRLK